MSEYLCKIEIRSKMIISFLYVFITFFLLTLRYAVQFEVRYAVQMFFFFKNLRITAKLFFNALEFVGTKLLLVFSRSYSR